jgi:hypothetical protein
MDNPEIANEIETKIKLAMGVISSSDDEHEATEEN